MTKSFIILMLLSTFGANAQEAEWLDYFFKKTKTTEVLSSSPPSEYENNWSIIAKNKKGKIGIFTFEVYEEYTQDGKDTSYIAYINTIIKPSFDDITSFEPLNQEVINRVDDLMGSAVEIAQVQRNNKTSLLIRINFGYGNEKEYLIPTEYFQSISWSENKLTLVPVQRKNKWGLYDWLKQEFVLKCDFGSMESLPQTSHPDGFSDSYSLELYQSFSKKHKDYQIDKINIMEDEWGSTFSARNGKTQKWGVYEAFDDEFKTLIPMEYDSIAGYSYEFPFTTVYQNGKGGIYLTIAPILDCGGDYQDLRQSVQCFYDEFRVFYGDGNTPKLAAKKDHKWGWIDWLNGEQKSEFKYDSFEDLPKPKYEQKWCNY